MKKSAFNPFASSRPALVLSIASSLLFSVTSAKGQDINEMFQSNNLSSGGNWRLQGSDPEINSAPVGADRDGSHKDFLFTSSTTTLRTDGINIWGRSYNVTNGESYTLFSNRAASQPTGTSFRAGSTAQNDPPTTFINSLSSIENDLVFLSNNSNLFFDGVNPVEDGPAPTFVLQLTAGNFNISEGSTLDIGMTITGNGTIVINGDGTTILSGNRSGSGATTINGGSLEISGQHTGTGTFNLNNGNVIISGSRSGGGTNIRNGIYEVTGTTGGVSHTIANTVDNPEGTAPELKLGNVNALAATATIAGSDAIARSGIVNLAVPGSYTLGSYVRGNITFVNSSDGPATLTFTNASAVSSGTNATRNYINDSADLAVTFASTLDIGSSNSTHVNLTTTGATTVAGGIISTGDGVRDLRKGGTGTLAVNGPSTYTGETRLLDGLLRLGHEEAIPGGIGATGGTSNLFFNSTTAVLGLTPASGDFLRTLGTGPDQAAANPEQSSAVNHRMGFAAFGGDRIVDLGAQITLGLTTLAGRGMVLGHATADSKVTVLNNINLNNASRIFLVNDGFAEVDAELSGVISHPGGTLVKTGGGTLALTGENTYGSDGGGTDVQAGVLRVNGSSLADTGKLVISGGIVHVTGTEVVGSLFFGSEEQSPGIWGSSESSAEAPFVDDTRFAGTGVIVVGASPGTPYDDWANGAPFDGDANGDGVPNGLAFLLGADNPQENALALLPATTEANGALVLTFQMRNAAARGDAVLNIQHSSDLGIADPWTTVPVPDTSGGPVNGVTFAVTPGSPLNTVTATIAATEADAGKLFARCSATEN